MGNINVNVKETIVKKKLILRLLLLLLLLWKCYRVKNDVVYQ